jgi:hypothetical protein
LTMMALVHNGRVEDKRMASIANALFSYRKQLQMTDLDMLGQEMNDTPTKISKYAITIARVGKLTEGGLQQSTQLHPEVPAAGCGTLNHVHSISCSCRWGSARYDDVRWIDSPAGAALPENIGVA